MTTTDTPVKLVFNLPKKSDPGFLRRFRNWHRLNAIFEGKGGTDAGDDLVDFYLDYLDPSIDKDDAREVILDQSEDDFDKMMEQFREAFEGKANSSAEPSNGKSTARSAPARGRQRTGRSS